MTKESTSVSTTSTDLPVLTQLDVLESEAMLVIREITAELERPVLLFSGGKDSVVMLHVAAKAFWPAPVPFPVLHVDTGHNFPEVLAYRDATVERLGLRLEVASAQDFSKSEAVVCTEVCTSLAALSMVSFIFFSSSSSMERLTSAFTSAT